MHVGQREPLLGVKMMVIVAAPVVPHWRTRAGSDALKTEVSAPEGNTISSAREAGASSPSVESQRGRHARS